MIYTCDRCRKNFPKRWKLTRHTERQYQCRAKAFVSEPVPVSIPSLDTNLRVDSVPVNISEPVPLQVPVILPESEPIPILVPSLLQSNEALPLDTNLRVNNANDRKPGETVRQWGSR